jgi:hypothetical protein
MAHHVYREPVFDSVSLFPNIFMVFFLPERLPGWAGRRRAASQVFACLDLRNWASVYRLTQQEQWPGIARFCEISSLIDARIRLEKLWIDTNE